MFSQVCVCSQGVSIPGRRSLPVGCAWPPVPLRVASPRGGYVWGKSRVGIPGGIPEGAGIPESRDGYTRVKRAGIPEGIGG